MDPARARSWCAVAAFAVIAVIAGEAAAQPAYDFDPTAVYEVPLGDSPRRGPADAAITVVEFSDFGCQYCERAQATVEQLERLYPGAVRWVFRHRPLALDQTLAAEATAAAALQGRFWPMHDRMFAVRGKVDRAAVELAAGQLGLDLARFRADLDSGRARALVLADGADGDRLGLAGTPTFFVNCRAVVGARGLALFAMLFADEQARADRVAGGRPPDLYQALIAGGRARADVPQPERLQRKLAYDQTYRIGLGLPGHVDGPADALVTIVVWSDLECPYCARLAPTLARLRRERARDVRVVFRHLPLPGHDGADLAAEAAVEAARAGKLWPFTDGLFAHQGPLTREVLLTTAAAVGVDRAAVAAALDDHRHRDLVLADGAAGAALGITGTPTIFLNGQPTFGALGYDALVDLVDGKLAGARALVDSGVAPADVYRVITGGASEHEPGDPRGLPRPRDGGELAPAEREAAVLAACRSGAADEARALAAGLGAARRDVLRAHCGDRGVDLP